MPGISGAPVCSMILRVLLSSCHLEAACSDSVSRLEILGLLKGRRSSTRRASILETRCRNPAGARDWKCVRFLFAITTPRARGLARAQHNRAASGQFAVPARRASRWLSPLVRAANVCSLLQVASPGRRKSSRLPSQPPEAIPRFHLIKMGTLKLGAGPSRAEQARRTWRQWGREAAIVFLRHFCSR